MSKLLRVIRIYSEQNMILMVLELLMFSIFTYIAIIYNLGYSHYDFESWFYNNAHDFYIFGIHPYDNSQYVEIYNFPFLTIFFFWYCFLPYSIAYAIFYISQILFLILIIKTLFSFIPSKYYFLALSFVLANYALITEISDGQIDLFIYGSAFILIPIILKNAKTGEKDKGLEKMGQNVEASGKFDFPIDKTAHDEKISNEGEKGVKPRTKLNSLTYYTSLILLGLVLSFKIYPIILILPLLKYRKFKEILIILLSFLFSLSSYFWFHSFSEVISLQQSQTIFRERVFKWYLIDSLTSNETLKYLIFGTFVLVLTFMFYLIIKSISDFSLLFALSYIFMLAIIPSLQTYYYCFYFVFIFLIIRQKFLNQILSCFTYFLIYGNSLIFIFQLYAQNYLDTYNNNHSFLYILESVNFLIFLFCFIFRKKLIFDKTSETLELKPLNSKHNQKLSDINEKVSVFEKN